MPDLHRTADGRYLAISPDGKKGRAIDSPNDLEPGWRLMSDADFEEMVDDVTEAAIAHVIGRIAESN